MNFFPRERKGKGLIFFPRGRREGEGKREGKGKEREKGKEKARREEGKRKGYTNLDFLPLGKGEGLIFFTKGREGASELKREGRLDFLH